MWLIGGTSKNQRRSEFFYSKYASTFLCINMEPLNVHLQLDLLYSQFTSHTYVINAAWTVFVFPILIVKVDYNQQTPGE